MGQSTAPVNDATRFGVLAIVTRPAGCGPCGALGIRHSVFCGFIGSGVGTQPGGGAEELIAPSVLNRTPADAVVSLDATVLLTNVTLTGSSIDPRAPPHPATLLAMMLLVTVTPYHSRLFKGNAPTSEPFNCCRRRPPPLPLSALLPMMRFALITRLWPTPSLIPGGQSTSTTEPHSRPLGRTRSLLAPAMARPPPLVGSVGLMLWLKRIQLLVIVPLKLTPECTMPPPSPLLMLPAIQL